MSERPEYRAALNDFMKLLQNAKTDSDRMQVCIMALATNSLAILDELVRLRKQWEPKE